MKILTALTLLLALQCIAKSPDAEPATDEKQKEMIALFGDYGVEPSTAKNYKQLSWQELRAQTKELYNKKVKYEGKYVNFNDTFPRYVEDSGYSAKRYYLVVVNSIDIPVLARRTKGNADLLGKLKKGAQLKVYGKIKKFRSAPKHSQMPRYFIYFDHVKVISNETKKETQDSKKDDLHKKAKEILDRRNEKRKARKFKRG